MTSKPSTLDIVEQIAADFTRRDLAHHRTDLLPIQGRVISVRSREMINFGSCSYLGLETHPDLIAGVQEAVARYGTQFSSSRAYISLGLYEVLEQQLRQMFGKPVVVSASTTLGHLAALPVLVRSGDVVILDLQVHHSVQTAAQQLRALGIPLHVIPHNDMDQLERKVRTLQNGHRRVWYLADGVYSMFGDLAPMDRLVDLMDRYGSFHTYIDDAHGMSWAGKHGTGTVRMNIIHHDKMVLAVSLNKAFASAGGALVFPNETWAEQVRTCGGTMIFSGPIQPPMLGAALASARLHLSPCFERYQRELWDLIDHTNQRIEALGLPQYRVTRTPLFFIPMGLPRVVSNLVHRILPEGFYVNMATFPATPMRQGGLRFMLNRHIRKDDIDALLDCVCHHYPRALGEEGTALDDVARTFKIPRFTVQASSEVRDARDAPALSIQRAQSIDEIDAEHWDRLFTRRGNITHRGLKLLEEVFGQEDNPENHWDFHYFIVRDAAGEAVLAAVYSVALMKDDMTSDAAISRQIEDLRRTEPRYLTSKVVTLGGLITKGEHLFLDRDHPQWRDALAALLDAMQETREQAGANQVMLREFFTDQDEPLRQFMLDQGYVELPLGDTLQVRDLSWPDHDAYLQRLDGKYRYSIRKEILAYEDRFELVVGPPATPTELDDCYALYSQVHARAFELNVFKLPRRFFEAMATHPDYEILRLFLTDDPRSLTERKPVAVMFSFVHAGVYSALIVGLDGAFIRTEKTYKQILYQTVQRAWRRGCELLDLAYTADLEKKKVGARPRAMCAYVQSHSHLNQMIIESMTLDSRSR